MDRIAKELFDSAFINRSVGDPEFECAIREARFYYKNQMDKLERDLLAYMRTTRQLRLYLAESDESRHYWINQAIRYSLKRTVEIQEGILRHQNAYVELETYIRLSEDTEEDTEEETAFEIMIGNDEPGL